MAHTDQFHDACLVGHSHDHRERTDSEQRVADIRQLYAANSELLIEFLETLVEFARVPEYKREFAELGLDLVEYARMHLTHIAAPDPRMVRKSPRIARLLFQQRTIETCYLGRPKYNKVALEVIDAALPFATAEVLGMRSATSTLLRILRAEILTLYPEPNRHPLDELDIAIDQIGRVSDVELRSTLYRSAGHVLRKNGRWFGGIWYGVKAILTSW